MKTDQPVTCLNCGHRFTGEYCNQCGEKVYAEHDKSFSHFLHDSFHFITHLDGKFLLSLKLVFTRPGLLAFEYCRGIRKRYFKPVSLFLIGVIIYLLFPLLQGLNISHTESINTFNALGISLPETLTVSKAKKKGITEAELGELYDAKSPKVAKLLLLILLPLTGLVLWLLFFRKRAYLFDHLILATEMNTLFLYSVFLFIPLILKLSFRLWFLVTGSDFDYGDPVIIPLHIVVMGAGWGIALRRFYQISRLEVIWKTFAFFILHSIVVYIIYRLILFLIVMAML